MRAAPPMLALALAACVPGAAASGEFGVEERVRSEAWTNITDYRDAARDGHQHYRFRSRLWTRLAWDEDLALAFGIANENRKVVRPDVAYNGRQVFVETLYVDWRFAKDWSVRAGRQDLMRGEGFVFMDGSALDGSRCAYVNALVLGRAFGRGSKVEFLAVSDPRQDRYLPRLNDPAEAGQVQRLNEWDERALAVYASFREGAAAVDGYLVYKTETGDDRNPAHPLFQPDRRLITLGGRIDRDGGGGWSAQAELAGQAGTQDADPARAQPRLPIRAWGGYARVRRALDLPWKPRLALGVVALSGDDPGSGRAGGWDPLFSRWPKWSELYIYSQPAEKGVAYWSNLAMAEAELRLTPAPGLDLRATWQRLAAFEAPGAPTAVLGGGRDRGRMLQLRADLLLGEGAKAHVLYERMRPGSFYAGRDPGYFLRFEVSCRYRKAW